MYAFGFCTTTTFKVAYLISLAATVEEGADKTKSLELS